ncbi:MAG: TolC family protein [Acidobacteriota bacterium]|nr:TolC family protein [Acidobacteriota bacterium]
MRRHKITLGFVICMLAAGCGLRTSPEEVNAAANEAVRAEQPEVPADRFESGEDIIVGWIDTFEDPTLIALVKEAQSNNKNLRAAAADVTRARALAVQAGAGLLPNVSLNAGGSRSGTESGAGTNLDLGLQVSWEADLWGRIGAGSRAAQAGAAAAEADLRYAQHSLAGGVAKAYFTVIDAGQKLAIAQETVEILTEVKRIVELKEENGMASGQDSALARSDLATAKESLATVEGGRRDAIRALELLLGRYPAAELELGKTLPKLPPAPPAGIPSQILERRPDLVAAERRVASAFEATAQAKAARLPSLSLTGNTSGASSSLSDLLDPANVAWRVGASLLAPLFDGGVRRADVQIATASQEQALAAYGAAALQAFSEVETGLDQGVLLARRRDELKTALAEAQEAYRIADLRYREGESELLDTLTIQQRVIAAKNNLASIERLLLEQRIDLHLALGGEWDQ